MALQYLLLAAQVGGFGMEAYGRRKAYKEQKKGLELERAQIGLRLKQEQLASEEQSALALENVREVMSSQQALFASQRRVPGIGSTAAISAKTATNFSKEERARSLTMQFREQYLKSQQQSKTMQINSSKKQYKADLLGSAFGKINFNSIFGGGSSSSKSPLSDLFNV